METLTETIKTDKQNFEPKNGMYGEFGGMYVPPHLEEKLSNLASFFEQETKKDDFKEEYKYYLRKFVGRPSPLYYARICQTMLVQRYI